MVDPLTLLNLEMSLRAVARQQHAIVTLDHFEAFLSPTDDYLLNLAVPTSPDPDDWTAHIRDLMELFADRRRRCRLEFFHELHPDLPQALELAGLVMDSKAPVMILISRELVPSPEQVEVTLRRLAPGDEAMARAFLARHSVAFGDSHGDGDSPWLPNLMDGLESGDVLAAGVVQQGTFRCGSHNPDWW